MILQDKGAIEVYIDKGNKNLNKERFDYLYSSKKKIENILGERLKWERLDKKRACRIIYTFDGIGLKNKDEWGKLQDKMIDKMILLEKAFRDEIANCP
mgnify:CR=1 FL=1